MSASTSLSYGSGLLGTCYIQANGAGKPVLAHVVTPRAGAFPTVNHLEDKSDPIFKGIPDEYIAKHKGDPALVRQMKNKVKKCACGKAVAFTLPACNNCGASLASAPISFTDNVFTGFMYGIEKGTFPFTISLRKQTPEILVFDDLLSLTPAHFNCIPTTKYMPDWRFLLINPAEGLALIQSMHATCCAVLKEQFLANKEYRSTILRDAVNLTDSEIVDMVACGFNYPPSQYQLHLQFMLPPFLPFQHLMYLVGNHFTKGRFFPFEYVVAVLRLNEPYAVNDDTPLEQICAHFATKGVDYDKIHAQYYQKYGESHARLANWTPDKFEGFVADNKVYKFVKPGSLEGALDVKVDAKAAQGADKLALQNFGRPYGPTGSPTGSFYKYPKEFPSGVQAKY